MSKANEYSKEKIKLLVVTGNFDEEGKLNTQEAKEATKVLNELMGYDSHDTLEISVDTYDIEPQPDGSAVRIGKDGTIMGKLTKDQYEKIEKRHKAMEKGIKRPINKKSDKAEMDRE